MKFIALKELPQGQQPGEEFDTTEAMGDVLVLVGAAKRKDGDDDHKSKRGGYQRRDMQAKAKSEPAADSAA